MPTTQWIIGELERLLAELKKTDATPRTGGGASAPSPPPAAALGAWKKARVTYWNVEEKEGKRGPFTSARVGLAWIDNGERKSEFLSTIDRDLIMRIDPLTKGDNVEYQSETNDRGYTDLVDLRLSGR